MSDRVEKNKIITGSMLFRGAPKHLLNLLANIAQQKNFQKGECIFLEGWTISGFYLIARGQVKIYQSSPKGKEQIIYVLGPGEPFGLTPIFHDLKYPACAASMVPTTTLFFPKTEFMDLINTHPQLALSMLAGLSQRLCMFAKKISDLALKEVPERLVAHLVYLSEKQDNTNEICLDMPKAQLACLLGTSPENLSRILGNLSRAGLIRVSGNMIEFLCYNELRRYS